MTEGPAETITVSLPTSQPVGKSVTLSARPGEPSPQVLESRSDSPFEPHFRMNRSPVLLTLLEAFFVSLGFPIVPPLPPVCRRRPRLASKDIIT